MVRKAIERLVEVRYAHERLYAVAEAENHGAEHVLLFAVICYKSAGQGEKGRRKPCGFVVDPCHVRIKMSEQYLNGIYDRLAYQEEYKALECGLPALAAIDNDYNGKNDPPFKGYADILKRCFVQRIYHHDEAGINAHRDGKEYNGQPAHFQISVYFFHAEPPRAAPTAHDAACSPVS